MKPIISVIVSCVFGFQVHAQVSFALSSSPGVGQHPIGLVATNVNGDGRVDLICANQADNSVTVLTNNGSGGFATSGTYAAGTTPYGLAAADVNGDGWVDLICANQYGNSLTVLTNNGSGGFATSGTYAVGAGPGSVVAADVNGDGWADLICANESDNSLTVLTNNGSGGFATSGTYPVGNQAQWVTAADVNGDGWVDLICVNYRDNTLMVLTNNGSGGFATSGTYAVGGYPQWVTAVDVNGDGKVDLITANSLYGGGTLSVLTNDGSGHFVLACSPSVVGEPFSVAAADVNGDGKVDLISANYGNNTLSVLTNDGSGSFVLASTLNVGSEPWGLTTADVNSDGNVDLICGNFGGATLSVLTNAPSSPPVIISQPTDQTVAGTGVASFSVEATGTPPLSYEWSLNGTNIGEETSSVLTISNVSQSDLGNYAVLVSNLFGSVTSSNALLSMYPYLAVPFGGVVTDWGQDTILSVQAWGTGPLSYQWFDNGVAILNATNQTLDLLSVQFTNAGLYSVAVSSPLGSVTNTPEQVVVNPAGLSLGVYPGITVSGTVGYTYIIQSNPDLSNTNGWTTMATLTLFQPVEFWVDVNNNLVTNQHRFYRALPGP
jgi:hypothetical protein